MVDVTKTNATSNETVFSRALGHLQGYVNWLPFVIKAVCDKPIIIKPNLPRLCVWKVGFRLVRSNFIWWCHFFFKGSLYSNISSSSYDLFLTSATGDGVKLWDLRSPRYVVPFASWGNYDHFNKSGVIGCLYSLEQGMWLMCQKAHHSILANGRIYLIWKLWQILCSKPKSTMKNTANP